MDILKDESYAGSSGLTFCTLNKSCIKHITEDILQLLPSSVFWFWSLPQTKSAFVFFQNVSSPQVYQLSSSCNSSTHGDNDDSFLKLELSLVAMAVTV
ncbi:hypothetical protein V6N13_130732 [Hibiscus sabdariffa]|uniref:Uncharacterized protein n=1 Tax=Hibiscus sabdariffa TaxID=183260 RepID=A0ABR2BP94_9ROSI